MPSSELEDASESRGMSGPDAGPVTASWARPVGRVRSWMVVRNFAVSNPWSVTL